MVIKVTVDEVTLVLQQYGMFGKPRLKDF